MRTSPALPWSADTERGTIRLNKYVTQQDLLDGILKWSVTDHGSNLPGKIVKYHNNKLYLADDSGQFMYEIADFSQSTNVLELTREQGSSESLLGVEFNTDAVRTNPATPWAAGTGGRIIFNEPITIQNLLEGQVVLGLNYNGEPADNVRFYQQQGSDSVQVMSGGNTVFGVTLENNVLYLNYIYQDNSYNLTSVTRLGALEEGIYATEESIVFKVDSNLNVYPIHGYASEPNASWARTFNNEVRYSSGVYPLSQADRESIIEIIKPYGGSDLYNIIDAGEYLVNLTINDIVILD